MHDRQHFLGRFAAGILILSGHETLLVVHDHVGRQHVAKSRLALEDHTRLAEFGFRMLRGDFDTQLLDLFVGHARHASSGNQEVSLPVFGLDQAEGAVAYAADDRCPVGVIGLRDFLGEDIRIPKVVGGTPATREEDHVILGEIDVRDRQRIFYLLLEDRVFQIAIVLGRSHKPHKRLGFDRDGATVDAGDVHLRTGIEKVVIRMRHFRCEDTGGRAGGLPGPG